MTLTKPSLQIIGTAIFVMVVTFLVFSPALRFSFLHYDDEIYVYDNPTIKSLSVDNIVWVFTHSFYKSYAPLVLISHAVDYAVWGLDPRGHHLTSLLLHSANAGWTFLLSLIIFSILRNRNPVQQGLIGFVVVVDLSLLAGAACSALLFSLHPLRVESVVWVADRKDVLMGFFALSSVISYLQYATVRNSTSASKWLGVTFVLFLLAVLSKNVAIMLPLIFVAADFFLLDRPRIEWISSVKEKWAFFLLAAAVAIVSYGSGGGGKSHYAVEYLEQGGAMFLPTYSLTFYLVKLVWPFNLSPIYLSPAEISLVVYSAFSITVIVLSILISRKGELFPLFCLSFLALLLLPTFVGLSAGIQPWADRYSYVPSVGFSLLVGAALIWLWGSARVPMIVAAIIPVALLAGCVGFSIAQIPKWKDSLTLWRYAVTATSSPTPLVIGPLGVAFYHERQLDSALVYYRKAMEIEPRYVDSYYNLGVTYEAMGNLDSAIASYRNACVLDSEYVSARNNLGNLYLRRKMPEDAIAQYNAILRTHPENAQAYYNLAVALESKGEVQKATLMYRTAILHQPVYSDAFVNLGSAKMKLGQPGEALKLFGQALKFDGRNPVLHFNLGVAYEAVRDTFNAIQSYTQAIQFKKDYLDAYVNLGNMYARLGLLENAAAVYEQAVNVGLDSADVLFNFGVVLEALGNGTQALQSYKHAIQKKETYLDPYINCANLYARMGYLDSAAAVYQTALRLGLDSAEVRGNLAIIQKEMAGKKESLRE